MNITFKVGEKAVYPAQGVGEIISIETREINGNKETFYVMKILKTESKILIPTKKAQEEGLRKIISKEKLKDIYTILKSKEISPTSKKTWNRRYREYMDKIKTGSVFEVAEVIRDLSRLKSQKDLSFGERKMLDTAKNLLVNELSIVKNTSEEIIAQEIKSIFNA
ncbi:MAG: CarD family transcriptional regulator [Deltaproteobacteria bacterium]|nr:CarD family transcriptional regulator [Deltaproteobacteria bacterium]